jgi:hypothetical protein
MSIQGKATAPPESWEKADRVEMAVLPAEGSNILERY